MLHSTTLMEIRNNVNTGVEYEIALFYKLLPSDEERLQVSVAIDARSDADKVRRIINRTHIETITDALTDQGLVLQDVSFETQNDEIGPSDIMMYAQDNQGIGRQVGLSVKYANRCTKNSTGLAFISDQQKSELWEQYITQYFPQYREYMIDVYGHARNWHRKRSPINNAFIDKVRNAVIQNWPNIENKMSLVSGLFHANSPVEFWVVEFKKQGYILRTTPPTIDECRANDVTIGKYKTSYVAFYLDEVMVGRMQVKFNNGFIERNFRRDGTRKKNAPDFIQDGLEFIYGYPFGSWNFSVEQ